MSKPKPTRPEHTQYPYCKDCGYNLTGVPLPQNNLYTCPECGGYTNADNAQHLPWYIGPTKTPILIATIPPSVIAPMFPRILEILDNLDFFLDSNLVIVGISLALTLTWFGGVALVFALKVARFKGPNEWAGPKATFIRITLYSTIWFPVILLATWVFLIIILRGGFRV